MSSPRASIFDADDLDISGFAPRPGPDTSAPLPEQVRAVAEAAASSLCVLAAAAPAVTLQAVYKKYCGAKFGEVARLVQAPAPTVL